MREVVVIGAGMHRYGIYPDKAVWELGTEAARNALSDAEMSWEDIETAYCGTGGGSGPSTGHTICRVMGLTGLGVTNVENASASGSAAFREAYLSVGSGAHDIAMAIGVDQSPLRVARPKVKQKPEPKSKAKPSFLPVHGIAEMARRHMAEHGTTRDQLAKVSVKSHFNASLNPHAHFQKAVTLEEVHAARMVADPFTVLHCCPWDAGGAAVIVCSKDVAHRFTTKKCPEVTASVLKSTLPSGDASVDLTRVTAEVAFDAAGIGPEDLGLIELHDAFTIEEIMFVEGLGLCAEGEGGRLVEEGVTALDGKHPINSSGGLISVGHPIGPTGVGQIAEILWQMRGECGKRQIPKPVNTAMAHMVGAGGVCFVHLFKV